MGGRTARYKTVGERTGQCGVIMLSQGAMAAGSMVWGVLAHMYGTRPTLAVVAALFAAYLALTAQRNRPLNERLFAGKKNE